MNNITDERAGTPEVAETETAPDQEPKDEDKTPPRAVNDERENDAVTDDDGEESGTETEPGDSAASEDGEENSAGGSNRPDDQAESASNTGTVEKKRPNLKIAMAFQDGHTVVGISTANTDPHFERVENEEPLEVVKDLGAIIERAEARWAERPRNENFIKAPPTRKKAEPKASKKKTAQAAKETSTATPATTQEMKTVDGKEEGAQQVLNLF